jgi:hypothetical protein
MAEQAVDAAPSEVTAMRRVLQLAPLAAAFPLLVAPGFAIIAVVMSWLAVGFDRQRPAWLARVLFLGTVAWLICLVLIAMPVGGHASVGTSH